MGWRVYADGKLSERGDDATLTVYDGAGNVKRPYTADERAAAMAVAAPEAAGLTLEQRVARLEAAMWPPATPPTTTAGVKSFTDWGGVVPPSQFVADGASVFRNVAGVPLTTAPSAMPGGAGLWGNLWQPVSSQPAPSSGTTPPPTSSTAPAWSGSATYQKGDLVTYGGKTYKALVPITANPTWTPDIVPALWAPQ